MYITYTHGDKKLHTLLVKHYNDLLYGQSSERSIDKVTYLLLCWGPFLYTPWHKVCQFLKKKSHPKRPKNFKTLPNFFFFKCNFINAPLRTLSIKQVIVVLY